MTEQEWSGCREPGRLLSSLHAFTGRCAVTGQPPPHPERFRLFACACCRRLWHLLGPGDRSAVECLERYARGGSPEALLEARRFHRQPADTASADDPSAPDPVRRMRRWARELASQAVDRAVAAPPGKPTKAAMASEQAAGAIGSWGSA